MSQVPQAQELHTVQVDFAGLMEVLGKNLYSTPLVAVRELVQNGHDSCQRRILEDAQRGESYTPAIRVLVQAPRTLIIEDNGAGLTRQEILDYLATIGSGYTRRLRAQYGDQGLIGAFGLGFLSAYVISDKVEVRTSSFKEPGQAWRFISKTGERFSVEPDQRPSGRVGTQVILSLREEFEDLADVEHLGQVLSLYCCLLPFSIYLGHEAKQPINAQRPPWRLSAEEAASVEGIKQRLAFAQRFEPNFEPIVAVEIPPSPDGAINGGIFWVQGGASWATSDNRAVSVFVRGMLVSRDERELLPSWAGFCGAVISSDKLTPTASREDLIHDADYLRAQAYIRESIILGLERVSRRESAAWRRIMRRHNEALRGAALADDRIFDLLADELTLPTSRGELVMAEVLRAGRQVYVSMYESSGHEEILFRAMQKPIIDGLRFASFAFTRRYCERRGIPFVQLGTRQGHDSLFPPEHLTPAIQERLNALFGREGFALKPTRFEPKHMPAVLVHDRDIELKRRIEDDEADRRISTAVLGLARLFTAKIDDQQTATLYLNLSSPALEAALADGADVQDPSLRALAQMIWSVAILMAPSQDSGSSVEAALVQLNDGLLRLLPR